MLSFDEVKKIIANTLEIDPDSITEESSFTEDLGADSLDKVEIIMQFEDALGVTVPDEEAETIVTVGDAMEKLKALK